MRAQFPAALPNFRVPFFARTRSSDLGFHWNGIRVRNRTDSGNVITAVRAQLVVLPRSTNSLWTLREDSEEGTHYVTLEAE